jgi:hypothetical protein
MADALGKYFKHGFLHRNLPEGKRSETEAAAMRADRGGWGGRSPTFE